MFNLSIASNRSGMLSNNPRGISREEDKTRPILAYRRNKWDDNQCTLNVTVVDDNDMILTADSEKLNNYGFE